MTHVDDRTYTIAYQQIIDMYIEVSRALRITLNANLSVMLDLQGLR